MRKYFIILIAALLAVGCSETQKPQGGRLPEKDSIAVNTNYDSIVAAKARAELDTNYRKSETYRYAEESYHRKIAEETRGMSHIDQLLYEYEIAVTSLNRMGRQQTAHPEAMANGTAQKLMSVYGRQAVELHDELATMKLSADQQRRFEQLNNKRD
ncbi:MAG: hypothetical protein PUD15_05725 [Prevotella sp.]|nr:hypothetical protein [Prevotella sp.]